MYDWVDLTEEEEAALDQAWAQIAAQDAAEETPRAAQDANAQDADDGEQSPQPQP